MRTAHAKGACTRPFKEGKGGYKKMHAGALSGDGLQRRDGNGGWGGEDSTLCLQGFHSSDP